MMTVMIALVAGVGFIEGNRQILDKIGWQSFYRTKGKMENGKDLIFHSQREIKHDLDTNGEKRCVLSYWWLLEPPRGVSVGASLKLWGRIAKIH